MVDLPAHVAALLARVTLAHAAPAAGGACALALDVTDDVRQRQLLQQRGVGLGILAKQLERRNAFITRTFGRYRSDDVVERILDDPRGLSRALHLDPAARPGEPRNPRGRGRWRRGATRWRAGCRVRVALS